MNRKKLLTIISLIVVIGAVSLLLYFGVRMNSGPVDENAARLEALDEASTKDDKGDPIIMLPKEEVSKFFITDSNGIFLNFEKDGEKWIYKDYPKMDINQDRIDKILNYLLEVKAIDYIEDGNPDDYGITKDSKMYTIEDASGKNKNKRDDL